MKDRQNKKKGSSFLLLQIRFSYSLVPSTLLCDSCYPKILKGFVVIVFFMNPWRKQKEYALMLCVVCPHMVIVYSHVLRYHRINVHHSNRGNKSLSH